MPKVKIGKTGRLLIVYTIKVLITSVISICALGAIVSVIYQKLDLNLNSLYYTTIVICAVSSYAVAKISVTGIRNNKLTMCLIAVVPMLIFICVNYLCSDYNVVVFIIKIVVTVCMAAIASMGKSKIKV